MNEFLKKTIGFYDTIKYVFMFSYIVFIIIPLPIPIFVYFVLPIINTLIFIFYKDYKESQKKEFMIYRITMLFYGINLPIGIIKTIENQINKDIPFIVKGLLGFTGFIIAFCLCFADNKSKEEKLSDIRVRDTLSKGKEGKSNDKYDVVLCKHLQTNKPVVINYLDRMLHFFVCGPTGCGKTSQVITPMILQDIQHNNGVIVIEPKGDLAEKVYAMGKYNNVDIQYFNPIYPDCPYFNPLDGKEDEVIETLTTTFNMLNPDSKTYFRDMADNLVRKSLMVLKRLEKAYTNPQTGISQYPATLIALSDLVHNTDGRGKYMVNLLCRIPTLTTSEKKQNIDTRDWFMNEYFADRSKVYENTSGIRTQIANLIQNKYLRKILNPENGKSEINFDEILENGKQIAISTAQGALRELGSYLGYFIIFTLQSAIFRRPGNENTRVPCFLYIDEFQKYANPGFSDILTQGRSYRIGALLATQTRDLVTMGAGKDGKAFLSVISANARNIVVFPGISEEDATFFSRAFGEKIVEKMSKSETKQKFSLVYGFRDMNYPTESIRYDEKREANYTSTDLTYKEFSEITYRIIKNNTVQPAQDGSVSWIPKNLNEVFDNIVSQYVAVQTEKRNREEYLEEQEKERLYADFLKQSQSYKSKSYESKSVSENKTEPQIHYEQENRFGSVGKSINADEGLEELIPEPVIMQEEDDDELYDEDYVQEFVFDDYDTQSINESLNFFSEDDGNFAGDF